MAQSFLSQQRKLKIHMGDERFASVVKRHCFSQSGTETCFLIKQINKIKISTVRAVTHYTAEAVF